MSVELKIRLANQNRYICQSEVTPNHEIVFLLNLLSNFVEKTLPNFPPLLP